MTRPADRSDPRNRADSSPEPRPPLPPSANPTRSALPFGALRELQEIVGKKDVLLRPDDLLVYDCDATTLEKLSPSAVVFVSSTREIQEVVRLCLRYSLPYTARGAGTGLSGGSLALQGSLILELSRMNRILDVDLESGIAVVEPGVVNLHVTKKVEREGYYYAPDPSSQAACTVGGNVAENSGGPHTLKYGVTTNHVLGLEVVLPDGEVLEVGGDVGGRSGFDLVGLFVGSEGTLGIVSKVTVRLLRTPEANRTVLLSFPGIREASRAASAIIGAGVIPAALEMMDRLVCGAVAKKQLFELPDDVGAVLLVEVDGMDEGLDPLVSKIDGIARKHDVLSVTLARTPEERARLWKARKGAFGAIGAITPSYYTHDGVIPRSKLPEVLEEIERIVHAEGLRVANVFHAGDGNLHPLLLFDERDPEQVARVQRAGEQILRLCVSVGGSLTGEHGIGCEKIDWMATLFTSATLQLMHEIRRVFDPEILCNPGKAVPTPGSCGEVKKSLGAKRYV